MLWLSPLQTLSQCCMLRRGLGVSFLPLLVLLGTFLPSTQSCFPSPSPFACVCSPAISDPINHIVNMYIALVVAWVRYFPTPDLCPFPLCRDRLYGHSLNIPWLHIRISLWYSFPFPCEAVAVAFFPSWVHKHSIIASSGTGFSRNSFFAVHLLSDCHPPRESPAVTHC